MREEKTHFLWDFLWEIHICLFLLQKQEFSSNFDRTSFSCENEMRQRQTHGLKEDQKRESQNQRLAKNNDHRKGNHSQSL